MLPCYCKVISRTAAGPQQALGRTERGPAGLQPSSTRLPRPAAEDGPLCPHYLQVGHGPAHRTDYRAVRGRATELQPACVLGEEQRVEPTGEVSYERQAVVFPTVAISGIPNATALRQSLATVGKSPGELVAEGALRKNRELLQARETSRHRKQDLQERGPPGMREACRCSPARTARRHKSRRALT